jgi:hypothetical protein
MHVRILAGQWDKSLVMTSEIVTRKKPISFDSPHDVAATWHSSPSGTNVRVFKNFELANRSLPRLVWRASLNGLFRLAEFELCSHQALPLYVIH